MARPKGSGPTRTSWKPGQSGNAGGRAKIVQEFAGQKALQAAKILWEIASGNIIEYDMGELKKLAGIKPDEELPESVAPFEFRKEGDRLKALEMFLKIAQAFPSEKSEVKLDATVVELTEEQKRARLRELLAAAAQRAAQDKPGGEE